MTHCKVCVTNYTVLSFMIAAAVVLKVVENSKIFTFAFIIYLKTASLYTGNRRRKLVEKELHVEKPQLSTSVSTKFDEY